VAEHEYPQDLKYTAEHEWVRPAQGGDGQGGDGQGGDGAVVRVGITSFAQDALGDIVFVQLPEAGTPVTAGEPCGEVESTKSVSDVYAPVTGTVVARNETLDGSPELINSDPYGDGWMIEIQVEDAAAVGQLLDVDAYVATIS
jgi:glycine cleavage system H protein